MRFPVMTVLSFGNSSGLKRICWPARFLEMALHFNRASVGTSAYWPVCVTTNFPQLLLAFALHLPHSHPHPIVGLTLSLGAEFWEHFSMWNAEVQLRGVTPVHCSRGKKRNRLWWGQFLLVPKKQALSHTDFLPHWTAQNNPRPTSKVKKKERGEKRQ